MYLSIWQKRETILLWVHLGFQWQLYQRWQGGSTVKIPVQLVKPVKYKLNFLLNEIWITNVFMMNGCYKTEYLFQWWCICSEHGKSLPRKASELYMYKVIWPYFEYQSTCPDTVSPTYLKTFILDQLFNAVNDVQVTIIINVTNITCKTT